MNFLPGLRATRVERCPEATTPPRFTILSGLIVERDCQGYLELARRRLKSARVAPASQMFVHLRRGLHEA
jgi:hypothetical protein